MNAADVRDPMDVLIDEQDPIVRAKALLELGLRAKAREDIELAVRHLHDAFDLDPTDEITKETLRSLGQPIPTEEPPTPVPFWRRWWRRS